MSRVLRGYQQSMIAEARGLLRVHQNILMVAPTGAGKTSLASYMLSSAAQKGKRGWFTVPKIELVEQTIETFKEMDIPYGVIADKFPLNPYMPIQICSIDTIRNRLGRYAPPDLVVVDEAHHMGAAGWKRVKEANAKAKHVGLSATPERLDGKGLDDDFSAMVEGPSLEWLIAEGYLSPYRLIAPPAPSMVGVGKSMGDYAKGESEAIMNKPSITGSAIQHYLKYARGKRAVVFCINIKHSKDVAAEFVAAGVRAVHIDGNTDKDERRAIMQAFKAGQIEVLCNCGIFSEGVDVPGLDVVILLRPTQSLSMYMQMVGRALRAVYAAGADLSTRAGRLAGIAASVKPYALILDHAGNSGKTVGGQWVPNHGLPDDPREWTLEGRKKRAGGSDQTGPPMRQCPKCYEAHRPMPKCPGCGYLYPVVARELETVDADLVEVDLEAARKRRVIENRKAESVSQLIDMGTQRGYKRPIIWAAHYHMARKGQEATLNELMAYAAEQKKADPVRWAGEIMSAVLRK